MLPILHLNGYKIANPTVLARIPREELEQLLRGYGWEPIFVEGDDPDRCIRRWRRRSIGSWRASVKSRTTPAAAGKSGRPGWPMIVLHYAQGLDGAEDASTARRSKARSGRIRCRSPSPRTNPEHLALLEDWLRSYRPEELFDARGRLEPELAELAPQGDRRMGANPHANGGLLLRDLRMPDFRDYAVTVPRPAPRDAEDTRVLGRFLRDVVRQREPAEFSDLRSRRNASNRLDAVFEATKRQWDGGDAPERRVPRARRARDGDAQRAPVPGLARRLSAHRPARPLQHATRRSSTSSIRCSTSTRNG